MNKLMHWRAEGEHRRQNSVVVAGAGAASLEQCQQACFRLVERNNPPAQPPDVHDSSAFKAKPFNCDDACIKRLASSLCQTRSFAWPSRWPGSRA